MSFKAHIHSSFEIICAVSGRICVEVDLKKYDLLPGDVIIVFPYQSHAASSPDKTVDFHCLFSRDIVSYFYRPLVGSVPECPVINLKDDPLFDIFTSCKINDDITKIKGVMYLLCSRLGESTEFVRKGRAAYIELIDKIFTYVSENYSENCSLEALADTLKYDYSYISMIFSRFAGVSFNKYVNIVRVSEACYLLKNTDKTITSVSEQCGFSSLRTFNRNFIQIMNMTPSDYRKLD